GPSDGRSRRAPSPMPRRRRRTPPAAPRREWSSEAPRALDGALFPPCDLVGLVVGLLPSELHRSAEERKPDPVFPPRSGIDAMNLERGAIAIDRLVFRVGKAPAIERHVPREVDAGRCPTGNGPIDEDCAAVGVAPEIAHLPVTVHERLRR